MGYDGSDQTNIILGDMGPDFWADTIDHGLGSGYIPPKPIIILLPFVVQS